MRIYIIGGGASGIAAAIAAARKGAAVTILEHKDRIGKKILATGNGRCNLTNLHMEASCFRGDDTAIVDKVLRRFDAEDTLKFFRDLGLLTKTRGNYVYPRTDQASTVLEILLMELRRLHVHLETDTHVTSVEKTKKEFRIRASQKEKGEKVYHADKVILASGGKAASAQGSDGSGYGLAKAMGHSLSPVVPALTALRASEKIFSRLAGIRTEATVTLYLDGRETAADTGELQLTNYGISGIPVFQVSRYASKGLYQKKEVTARIDFLPAMCEKEFLLYLSERKRKETDTVMEEFLIGVFHKKLIPVFLEYAGIGCHMKAEVVSEADFQRLVKTCKGFPVHIIAANSFEQAQVCAGGVRTAQVKADTLESIYTPGFYLTGELLDIDGICGGYNLQWAWATGYLAGRDAAAERVHRTDRRTYDSD
ncbi:aminoacetone oxidase family FAD-binding enzyme [Dorea acetigenes]|uniref:Aminoacetone oxidase family FAD-binding enzyme n=1 Tax=Dorea acetigenes TaxID=2981787 RepID=A0ABT2RJB7_9FIRM|nr:aminoacetone oxidase family FAD-binding enzyme [Dorea acetigenes]MCU6685502.1 aminoacetone oxidase family FAD-binding enzyme [Dorea acetigenes]SCI53824.1 tricarballylate dehydrogenase [uncultured Clostridium sp.]